MIEILPTWTAQQATANYEIKRAQREIFHLEQLLAKQRAQIYGHQQSCDHQHFHLSAMGATCDICFAEFQP